MEFIDDERIAWLGRVSGKQGLLIFNVADAEMVSAIEIPTSSTLTGAMSPNGQHFAVTDTKGLVIYDLEEGKPAAQLPRPPDREGINLGFNNCRELTFAPDGEQLAGLFSVRDGSRLVVWNGMTEIVVDEIIPRVSAPGFNPVDVLQWASDQSGWLIGHRHYYSRSARRVVWTLGVQNLAQPPIKFVGEDRLLTFSRKGRNKVGLVELHVPRKEIRSAVAALESGEAILKPGDAVSLDIRVGAVRFASKQEVLDDLTNTLTERFRQEGFVVAPGATNVFSVEYSESAGAVTQIVEQDQFGRPAKTVGTTQQTETSLHARFTAQNGQTVLWEKKSDGKSFNYGQVSSTDPKDLRKSRYNGAKSAIAGGWRPYFVSTREDVPQLPLLTQP